MPRFPSASAPVRRSNAISPGSATPTRSGRSCPPRLPPGGCLASEDLQEVRPRRQRSELVPHLDGEPEHSGLLRRAREDAGPPVEDETGRSLAAVDLPQSRDDAAQKRDAGQV